MSLSDLEASPLSVAAYITQLSTYFADNLNELAYNTLSQLYTQTTAEHKHGETSICSVCTVKDKGESGEASEDKGFPVRGQKKQLLAVKTSLQAIQYGSVL